MDAKIRRTSDGTYYVQLEAENTIERIEMTALREQLRANSNVLTEYGSAFSHCAEVGRALETQIGFVVQQNSQPMRKNAKKRFLFPRRRDYNL